jgi:hypothetical protein
MTALDLPPNVIWAILVAVFSAGGLNFLIRQARKDATGVRQRLDASTDRMNERVDRTNARIRRLEVIQLLAAKTDEERLNAARIILGNWD